MIDTESTPTTKLEAEIKNEKLMVVKNAVSDFIHEKGLKVSVDSFDALNDSMKEVISRACYRSQQNGRKTVLAQDY